MEPAPRLAQHGNFLRYQFDNAAQVLRHCRLVDGRVLLFFPDPFPLLPVRSRALIELTLASGHQVALPAQVAAREDGRAAGTWLAVRALGLVAGLRVAVDQPRRRERRLAFDQLAWVEHDGPVLACPVLDLSRGGARLWGVPGGCPARDQELHVRFYGGPPMSGRIAWAHGREVGIHFDAECLADAERLYQRIEQTWDAARVVAHDPLCHCASGGAATDPPVPYRARRLS